MLVPPTPGSLSIAVLTRVVIVVSSIVSPMVFPQPATSGAAITDASSVIFQQPSFCITGLRRIRGPKGPALPPTWATGCKLHTRDVEARVHHQHLAGNASPCITKKECRRFTYFA